jgi:hypothetical protein
MKFDWKALLKKYLPLVLQKAVEALAKKAQKQG